jgi:hypothetical protein
VRVLLRHVHRPWATAFARGPHTCLVPVTPDRSPDGLGRTRTWTGEPAHEPVRRGRTTGRTDLLPACGVSTEGRGDHLVLASDRCRSRELSLLEAMHLGMPVVALATTEVSEAVPDGAGAVANRIDVLTDAVRDSVADPPRTLA